MKIAFIKKLLIKFNRITTVFYFPLEHIILEIIKKIKFRNIYIFANNDLGKPIHRRIVAVVTIKKNRTHFSLVSGISSQTFINFFFFSLCYYFINHTTLDQLRSIV